MIRTIFVLAFLTTALGQSSDSQCCPDGWVVFQNCCYYFTHDTPVDFIEAENYCKNHNGHLVNVGSLAEDLFIKDFIGRFNESSAYWMGLTDEIVEQLWAWRDTGLTAEYTGWAPGEPNSFQGNEDCAIFYRDFKYQWADAPCLVPLAPICEIELHGSSGTAVVG